MGKIKEIWNNRKTRGIIFLIFYLILFSYIFIVYGNKSEKILIPDGTPEKEKIVLEKTYSSYKYEYIIGEESTEIVKYNDVVNFKYNDIDYYYLSGKCYKLEGEKFYEIENPLKYNFDYLNKITEVKNLSTRVRTSKYEDGREEENYNINLAQFLELFGLAEEADAKEMTNYSIFYRDNNIEEIFFTDLNVRIKYTSFEDVEEVNTDYEIFISEE